MSAFESPVLSRLATTTTVSELHQLPVSRNGTGDGCRLAGLADLASVTIETSLASHLSDNLHSIFDPVCDRALPIYFGPLLGRLYLEGL